MMEYLRSKAGIYLEMGPEQYAEQDALEEPSFEMDDELAAAIRAGCDQLVAGRGFSRSAPLTGVGVQGLYVLLQIFHFERVAQRTHEHDEGMLDELQFEHAIMETDVTLYNLVEAPSLSLDE